MFDSFVRTSSIAFVFVAALASRVAGQLEWVHVSDDRATFTLGNSGKSFVPWGFNYDHDRDGRLIEDYWDDDWPTIADDFHEMRGFSTGKPVVVEEFFPLKCSAVEAVEFIGKSKGHASGWISFCWGKTPDECRESGTLQDALIGQWPEKFAAGGRHAKVSRARRDDGVLSHTVDSEYQSGSTEIRVLLPSQIEVNKKYRVLYILPVEAGTSHRWGDSISEVRKHDLHNKYGLICVFPTFSHLPWYADHASDLDIRQESYFIHVVVPFIEQGYPALAKPEGRMLVGFSKSGWGAWSLLLRHSEIFGRAAAWDAPLMMEQPNRYGMGPIFGTQENFEKYRIAVLLGEQAQLLSNSNRLMLLGHGNFRADHEKAHVLMQQLSIGHTYRDGPKREHSWESGWLPEAVQLLVRGDSQ